MKSSTSQTRKLRPAISKIAMALAVVSVIGGVAMASALARDNDRRDVHQDKGWHKGERQRDQHRPVYQRPYYYSQPVYAPPPVYYAPQPSPGISFFIPLDIHIR